MEPKLPSESKLVWLGVVQILIGIMGAVPAIQEFLASQVWDFSDAVAAAISVLTIVIGVLTIILRALTKQPLTWTK